MQQLLNTLFITTEGTYVRLDHDTLRIDVEGKTAHQVPLIHVGTLACFGNVLLSPFLLHRLAEEGRPVALFDRHGRFKARVVGETTGNVLLRCAQHEAASDSCKALSIARNMVAGKIRNCRQVLLRSARENPNEEEEQFIRGAAEGIAQHLSDLGTASPLDTVRGIEGDCARRYFAVFGKMIRDPAGEWSFDGRNRRPPRDPVNALLSFLYALVQSDCASALEGVGLDPQVGFLHGLRPGRPALALDLMEELRPVLADRLALTLINRKQLSPSDFAERPGGAVHLDDEGRKTVLVAYQKRKQDEIEHPVLERKIPLGLVSHTQARLLTRHLRGDVESYVPFLYR